MIVATDLENQPFFENFLEHFATSAARRLIGPYSGQPGNLAEAGTVVESLEPSPLHGLDDVTSQHQSNDN